MKSFHSKEEREKIQALNEVLGMQHRDKPYDYKNVDDLKEITRKTIAELMDYGKYWYKMDSVLGEFDESIEYYDPITWMSISQEDVEGDKLTFEAYHTLLDAVANMSKMYDRSEDKCRLLIEIIMGNDADTQEQVWGSAYTYNEAAMDELFEGISEIPDTYTFDESYEAFMNLMEEVFGAD